MSVKAFTDETGGLSGGESADRATGGGLFDSDSDLVGREEFSGEPAEDMDVLAVLNLGDFAQIFSKMGMFPVFDLAYYIVSILYLKYEPGENKIQEQPFLPAWKFDPRAILCYYVFFCVCVFFLQQIFF